jgi:predicted enzyme related to lactoylglutathione lyase
MAETPRRPIGSFCWVELATSDLERAEAFYTALFGWSVTKLPLGPGETYLIFQLSSIDAAAAYRTTPGRGSQEPRWSLYVSVEDVDRSAERVKGLGGTLIQPHFDVMDAGRTAPVADPSGAFLALWQSKRSHGIGPGGAHGTLCWADLQGKDAGKTTDFYGALFGWTFMKGEKDDYLHIKNGEEFIGGIPLEHQEHTPASWLAYFLVDDCRASVGKARGQGAKVLVDTMTLEKVGTFAVLNDPQGATFAVFEASR